MSQEYEKIKKGNEMLSEAIAEAAYVEIGREVRAYDVERKRWYKGKVLYVTRLDKKCRPDAWAIEFNNGNRGNFDREHLKLI